MLFLLIFIYCSFCTKSSKSIDFINSQNILVCLDISSCLNSINFVVDLFGVLGPLSVCWSYRNGIGDDPWFDRCDRIYISRRPLG